MKKRLRYVFAIVAVSLSVLLRYALVPLIGPGLPYVTLFPVTVSVALLAGFGPAILTGILGGMAADYFFIPPLFTAPFDFEHLSRLALVTLTSAFVGYVGDRLRSARAKAESNEQELRKAHSELETRVQERTAELARTNEELEEEITERTKAELRISRLNRLYSVLSKANEAIVRIHEPEELYVQLCRIAVENGLFKMAWIGLTDRVTRKVEVAASFGDTGGYLDGIQIYAADVPGDRGPTGKAAFDGNYSICSDIEHDPQMAPWRDKALGHGFRSLAAFPLRMGPAIIGAFTIYPEKLQFFTDEEIKLLSSLAEDVSFAIESMANEKKRIEAEEALRVANVYNRSLLEASLDPLVTIDAGGKITDVNIATENVTGHPREELIGTDFSDYFTQRDKAQAGYQKVFSEGLVKDYSLEIRHQDGHITPVLYNAAVYRDETGKVIGVFAAARDITKRRETERRNTAITNLLKLFTAKFVRKEYLDAAVMLIRDWSGCPHVGMRIADEGGNIPYESCIGFTDEFLASESLLSLRRDQCACTRIVLGAPEPQDLSAMTHGGSFYSNNTMKFIAGLTEEEKSRFRGVCIRSGFASVAVIPIRHRERTVGAIHLADEREGMVPIDKVEFIEQMAYVIGEAMFRFGIEEELQKLNKELEERVADRTARLEAANRELDAFSYSVSHDLRAPLRSIDGFSQALLEDYWEKLDDNGKDFLKRVRAGSQRMGQLIDDLLNLSRVTRSDMSRGLVNLSDLAHKAADELRYTQPDRKVEFIIAEGVTAEGDDGLLFLLLENLISNAWKFTGKNPEAKIEFGAFEYRRGNTDPGVANVKFGASGRREMDGKTIYFVRDNGIGFDMCHSFKLGMPFQRLHSVNEYPGTGIGLATVKRIINRHGGTLWMEGEVGKGATAYFTL